MIPIPEDDRPMVLNCYVLSCQVCVPKTMTKEEVCLFAEKEFPSGSLWVISPRVPQNVQCVERPNHVHFLLDA